MLIVVVLAALPILLLVAILIIHCLSEVEWIVTELLRVEIAGVRRTFVIVRGATRVLDTNAILLNKYLTIVPAQVGVGVLTKEAWV
jgi:hypothetical protein